MVTDEEDKKIRETQIKNYVEVELNGYKVRRCLTYKEAKDYLDKNTLVGYIQ